jgi:hypothetical protein
MEGWRVGEGGDMTGKSPTGEGIIMKIGGRSINGKRSVFMRFVFLLDIFWF